MVFANGKRKLLPLIPLIAALAACGGGGGGGTTTTTTDTTAVTGLAMPVTMSALAASSGSGSGAPGVKGLVMDFYGAYKAITTQTFASTSNYMTDETHTYVYDSSMETLQTVNMILCLMDQTKASDMVNKGAYIALVNEDKCEQGQNKGGGGGSTGQSSGQTVAYNKWTINSTRASNTDSQIVKIWIPSDPAKSTDGDILVEVTIAEGVSTTKPYGDFVLNFKGVDVATGVQRMGGTLKTVSQATGSSKSQFQYFNLGGGDLNPALTDSAWTEKSNVILNDATGTGGQARTYRKEQYTNSGHIYGREATYAVAFNTALVLRDGTTTTSQDTAITSNTNAQACMSRTSFNKQVWRYNLYHETATNFNGSAVTAGQRVTLNSGFPFKTADGKFGHVGYWGIWMEGNTTPADGATITKVDYSSTATGADYKVNIAPGRLIRRTAKTETMTNLQGAELYYWGQVGSTFGNYLATVDTNNNFIATDTVAWGQNGRTLTPLPAGTVGVNGYQTTPIPGYNVTPSTTGQNLWLWSDALGGNVTYVYTTVAANSRTVTFYAQEYVMPGDTTLFTGGPSAGAVKCYDRCLKGGLDATAITTMGTNESQLYYPTNGTAYAYTVSSSGGKVTVNDDNNATQPAPVSADGLNLSALGHDWGASTGEMVPDAVAATLVNPWDLYDPTKVTTSYRWETGSNQWNKMITVTAVADGALRSFDKPLQFTYTHSTADDANADTAYNAKKFQLQYGGPGELWGFPWMEDTTNPGHWRSAVTLKDGVVLTDGTNSFVAKAIEQEQTMKYAPAASDCDTAGLSVAGLTDAAMPFLTASGTVSFSLTDKPAVTTAPAVIEGVLQ